MGDSLRSHEVGSWPEVMSRIAVHGFRMLHANTTAGVRSSWGSTCCYGRNGKPMPSCWLALTVAMRAARERYRGYDPAMPDAACEREVTRDKMGDSTTRQVTDEELQRVIPFDYNHGIITQRRARSSQKTRRQEPA